MSTPSLRSFRYNLPMPAVPGLAVIIPAYREARTIARTLEHIRTFAAGRPHPTEVIVVDDGSDDATAEVVQHGDWRPLPVRLLRHERNLGKGAAVRTGMLAAQADLLLMYDADMSARMEELDRLLPRLAEGHDIVIGSRDLPESVLDPSQPVLRLLMAHAFRAVRRRLLLPELRDTQCGFKLFRAEAARKIFPHLVETGWTFDCEVLGRAAALDLRIAEVGIHWSNRPRSRVRPLRDTPHALLSLLRIRNRVTSLTHIAR